MTRKINLNFIFVIALSVFLSVFFTAFVSYRLLQKEVFEDLASYAEFVEALELAEQMKNNGYVEPENDLRITWVAADGSVLYDSYAKDTVSANHKERPEIMQAMRDGVGMSVRRSQTMERNLFFYARKAADGTVIRIAKEAGSIWNIYKNTLPFYPFWFPCGLQDV